MYHTASLRLSALLAHIEGAYAPNTIRAYRADMKEFIAYCEQSAANALPAEPGVIAEFLLHTVGLGIKSSTIRRKVSSISSIHLLSNLGDPTKHPEVKLCIRRIHRQLGTRFNQAYPVTKSILDRLIDGCGNDLRSVRNRALLLLAYDSMRRRSEIVSLRADDIDHRSETEISILLRKSKTDQFGTGYWIHLGPEASIAVSTWLATAQITEGFIFRGISPRGTLHPELNEGQVARILKSLARKAQLDENIVQTISGHSMRVGSAQDLMTQGASLPQIMMKGGWAKTDTVMRYIERVRRPVIVPISN